MGWFEPDEMNLNNIRKHVRTLNGYPCRAYYKCEQKCKRTCCDEGESRTEETTKSYKLGAIEGRIQTGNQLPAITCKIPPWGEMHAIQAVCTANSPCTE